MKKLKMKTIFIGFLILSTFVCGYLMFIIIQKNILQEVKEYVHLQFKDTGNILNAEKEKLKTQTEISTKINMLSVGWELSIPEKMGHVVKTIHLRNEINTITIVDLNFMVKARAHLISTFGDELKHKNFIMNTLKGKSFTGYELLSPEELKKENINSLTSKISLTSSAPIIYEINKQIIGAVIFRIIFNKKYKNIEIIPLGKEFNSLDNDIKKTIITNKTNYNDLSTRQNSKLYSPILDADNNIIGIIKLTIDTQFFIEKLYMKSLIILLNIALANLIIFLVNFSFKLRRNKQELEIKNNVLGELNNSLEEKVEELANAKKSLEELNISLHDKIEELDKTKEYLVEQEKLAALGKTVAGVAHEINNPLGLVLVHVSNVVYNLNEKIKEYKEGDFEDPSLTKIMIRDDFLQFIKEIIPDLNIAIDSIKKAAERVKDFKKIAIDSTKNEHEYFNILENVIKSLNTLNSMFKMSAHKCTISCPEDIEILSDPGKLYQILINLVINSFKHGFENIEQGNIYLNFFILEDCLNFIYSDDGIGMAEQVRTQIFEPFFTTKKGTESSGLGMSIVYNLINSLGGRIICNSIQNICTTFAINIPLTEFQQKKKNLTDVIQSLDERFFKLVDFNTFDIKKGGNYEQII